MDTVMVHAGLSEKSFEFLDVPMMLLVSVEVLGMSRGIKAFSLWRGISLEISSRGFRPHGARSDASGPGALAGSPQRNMPRYDAAQCNIRSEDLVRPYAVLSHSTHSTVEVNVRLCSTLSDNMQYSSPLCSALLCHALLCSALLCSAPLC